MRCHVLFCSFFMHTQRFFAPKVFLDHQPLMHAHVVVQRAAAFCTLYSSNSATAAMSWQLQKCFFVCGLAGLWPNDTLTVGLPLPIQITSPNPLYITLHSHIFFSQDIYRLPTLIIFCSRPHIYFRSVDCGREGRFNSYLRSRPTSPKQQ